MLRIEFENLRDLENFCLIFAGDAAELKKTIEKQEQEIVNVNTAFIEASSTIVKLQAELNEVKYYQTSTPAQPAFTEDVPHGTNPADQVGH